MNQLLQELQDMQKALERFVSQAQDKSIREPVQALEESAQRIGQAWSGSWIGYQANVYFSNLETPPPGNHFSSEWGFMESRSAGTRGKWEEFASAQIIQVIQEQAGHPDTTKAFALAEEANSLFRDTRDQLLSIVQLFVGRHPDEFLEERIKELQNLKEYSPKDYAVAIGPPLIHSRDSLAISQGVRIPPHIDVLSRTIWFHKSILAVQSVVKIAAKIEAHIKRSEIIRMKSLPTGTHIFIGHGHSHIWQDLKNFIHDRLNLEWDEFNRVPIAGISNIERLSAMLDTAAIAFLVMTAEDDHADGSKRARMNVIHEAGLFQGRLGFRKAIILLEEGCEEFSNIQGLGQIHFPKGNIEACFEQVRATLEREGIL